mgnify:CR=1 FL=1
MTTDLNLSRMEIRPPRPSEWRMLCRMLAESFPVEGWLWPAMSQHDPEFSLYNWSPLCMFHKGQIIGNVSRLDISIWFEGERLPIAGIASVATVKRYRRMGVATTLLSSWLERIDRDGLTSALFYRIPKVFERSGYRTVPQGYVTIEPAGIRGAAHGLDAEQVRRLDETVIRRLDRIYAREYPNYNGKVLRDEGYWQFYKTYFNRDDNKRILLCRCGLADMGYARIEDEADRLLVSEFCCGPDDQPVIEALLSFIYKAAQRHGVGQMSLALPDEHFLWGVFKERGIATHPEIGMERVSFMLRGPRGDPPGRLNQLRWCLADKF